MLTLLVQILLLQPFFLGLSSLFGVVTQLSHRFVLYALSPLVYNVGIIFGIFFLYPLFGLAGIAFGVVLGAIAHCAIQWPLVRRSNLRFGFSTRVNWPRIRRVLYTSIPRACTLSLNQIVLLVLVSIAGTLTAGSVSVMQFALNLQAVPLAIIGASYSVAAFPRLAQLFAEDKKELFAQYIMTALRHIIFWSVPVIVLCIVLRAQLVRVILGSGSFNWEDTRLTAAVFAVFIVALLAHGINLLLVRAFYAGGNTRIPLYASLVGATIAISAAYAFTTWYSINSSVATWIAAQLRVTDVAGTEVIFIALAYTIALILQSCLLFWWAKRSFLLPTMHLNTQLQNACVAALFGGVAAYAALQFFVVGVNTQAFLGIFLQGLLAGIFGIIGVILGYSVMGSNELREVSQAINKRIFKTNVVAPQSDIL